MSELISNHLAALAPLTTAGGASGRATLHPAWRLSGLPNDKAPLSKFEAFTLNGESVLAQPLADIPFLQR